MKTDEDKALAASVHEGVSKGNGRVILGSVTLEVYRRIEEYGRRTAGTNASSGAFNAEASAVKATQEQHINLGSADTPAGAPAKTGLISPLPNPRDTYLADLARPLLTTSLKSSTLIV